MKKPLNKFALLLWAIAIVGAAFNIWSLHILFHTAGGLLPAARLTILSGSVWRTVNAVLVQSAILVSLGMLIEMVDQIRWQILRAP
jgi:hypothetical protein